MGSGAAAHRRRLSSRRCSTAVCRASQGPAARSSASIACSSSMLRWRGLRCCSRCATSATPVRGRGIPLRATRVFGGDTLRGGRCDGFRFIPHRQFCLPKMAHVELPLNSQIQLRWPGGMQGRHQRLHELPWPQLLAAFEFMDTKHVRVNTPEIWTMLWRLCGLSSSTAPRRRTASTALEGSVSPGSEQGASAQLPKSWQSCRTFPRGAAGDYQCFSSLTLTHG